VGQIYVPLVNAICSWPVIGLVLGFGSSSRLAAASAWRDRNHGPDHIDDRLVIFRIWRWNRLWAVSALWRSAAVRSRPVRRLGDQVRRGGWLPASVAVVLIVLFSTWRKGRTLIKADLEANALPTDAFLATAAKGYPGPWPGRLPHQQRGGRAAGPAAQSEAQSCAARACLPVPSRPALTPPRSAPTVASDAGEIGEA